MLTDPLRVTVLMGGRRVDVAVPAGLPVAELLPLLVARGGGPDPGEGLHLGVVGGPDLDPGSSLGEQGVRPGAVLAVTTGPFLRLRHDDPAEALGAAVAEVTPWTARHGAGLQVGAVVLVGALAVTGLVRHPEPAVAAALAAVATTALLAYAASASRAGRADGVLAALLGCLLAAAAVSSLVPVAVPGAAGAVPTAAAWLTGAGPAVGATLAAGGLAGVVALGQRRPLLLPAVVLGAGLLGLGLLVRVADPVAVVAVLLTTVVALGGLAPGAALGLVGLGGESLHDPYEVDPGPDPGAPAADAAERLTRDAALAGDLLAGALAGAGCLLVVGSPLLALGGRPAAALAAVLALHVLLRSRRSRSALLVAADLGAGAVSLTVVVVVLLLTDPGAGRVLAAGLALAVPLLLALGTAPSVRRRRVGDLAETATAVGLLPLLVVVSGVLDRVG